MAKTQDKDPEKLVKDFIKREDEINRIDGEMIKATQVEQRILDELKAKLDEAAEVLRINREPHNKLMLELEDKQADTKGRLAVLMGHDKQLDTTMAKIEKRITKKVTVADKAAVADILIKNGKVVEGVNSFNITFIKGLDKAGLIPAGALEVNETENIYVRRK